METIPHFKQLGAQQKCPKCGGGNRSGLELPANVIGVLYRSDHKTGRPGILRGVNDMGLQELIQMAQELIQNIYALYGLGGIFTVALCFLIWKRIPVNRRDDIIAFLKSVWLLVKALKK